MEQPGLPYSRGSSSACRFHCGTAWTAIQPWVIISMQVSLWNSLDCHTAVGHHQHAGFTVEQPGLPYSHGSSSACRFHCGTAWTAIQPWVIISMQVSLWNSLDCHTAVGHHQHAGFTVEQPGLPYSRGSSSACRFHCGTAWTAIQPWVIISMQVSLWNSLDCHTAVGHHQHAGFTVEQPGLPYSRGSSSACRFHCGTAWTAIQPWVIISMQVSLWNSLDCHTAVGHHQHAGFTVEQPGLPYSRGSSSACRFHCGTAWTAIQPWVIISMQVSLWNSLDCHTAMGHHQHAGFTVEQPGLPYSRGSSSACRFHCGTAWTAIQPWVIISMQVSLWNSLDCHTAMGHHQHAGFTVVVGGNCKGAHTQG